MSNIRRTWVERHLPVVLIAMLLTLSVVLYIGSHQASIPWWFAAMPVPVAIYAGIVYYQVRFRKEGVHGRNE